MLDPMRMEPLVYLGMILLFILIYNRITYVRTVNVLAALRCLVVVSLLGIDQPGATVSAIPFMRMGSDE